ncbi:hypothetical protein ACMWRF_001271 [Enterobacter hormaechei]
MSTITKEQLRERARQKVKSLELAVTQTAFADSRAELEEELELARIALASLEAEPVAWLLSGGGAKNNVSFDSGNAYADPLREVTPLYTAPPAPVSVPDAIHSQGEKSVGNDYYALGWNACRAAMLQGAEPVTTAYKFPDDFDFDRFNDVVWLEAVASNPHMHSLTTSTIAMVALELNKRLEAGNSPVIPDGWVLVPVEPTAEMYDAGDRQLATKQVWDAMIAAAPRQEADNG